MTKLSFDTKDVISVLNVDDAEEYIGKEGYCSNTIYELQEAINNRSKCKLVNVVNRSGRPFTYEYHEDSGIIYDKAGLFLPANKVKREKKWRPFTLEEFMEIFKVGDVITFRTKDSNYHGKWLYTGCTIGRKSPKIRLYLGTYMFSFQELFDEYEYLDKNDNWNLFGVVD